MLKVKIYPTYKKSLVKEFEISENATFKELDKQIRIVCDPYSSCGRFSVGHHTYFSWDDLKEQGYVQSKGLQQCVDMGGRISNSPFTQIPHENTGTFDKTLFQLFSKDGIWKFQYKACMQGHDLFNVELREA